MRRRRLSVIVGKLKRYLLAGFLVIAPAYISIYILLGLLRITDRWARSLFPEIWYEESRVLGIPGMGLVILLALLVGVGFFASGWIGRFFIDLADRVFAGTPVVSNLYSTLKKLFHALLGENTTSFRQVVYVQYPRLGIWSIGFLTGRIDGEEQGLGEGMVCVFIPTTPNPTSGYLIVAPKDEIREANMTVEQAFKMVVSLGMTK